MNCPLCGFEDAYIGLSAVECPNWACTNFSVKQLKQLELEEPAHKEEDETYVAYGGRVYLDTAPTAVVTRMIRESLNTTVGGYGYSMGTKVLKK